MVGKASGKSRKKQKQKKYLIYAVGIAFVLILVSGGLVSQSTILPGYEGEMNGMFGYQPNGQAVSELNSPLSASNGACSYQWNGDATPSASSLVVTTPYVFYGGLLGCSVGTHTDTLNIGYQTHPVLYNVPQTVNYNLPVPNSNQTKYITGTVNNYTMVITLQIEPSSAGGWGFAGDTIWGNVSSPVYDRAIPDPNNNSVQGPAFEAPLYGVVKHVVWKNEADTTCSLCQVGASLDFYPQPAAENQIITLSGTGGLESNLNGSLSSNYSPDSRMQSLAYYPLTITHMENDCTLGVACQAPEVSITIALYTLQLGEFILTNPDKTNLSPPTNNQCDGIACPLIEFINGVGAAIDNAILSLVSTAEGAIVVVMVGVIGYLFYSSSRKKKGPPVP